MVLNLNFMIRIKELRFSHEIIEFRRLTFVYEHYKGIFL